MSASNKSLVTITENESKNLRSLPDKLNIGPTHFIRVQFEYILDNVDALLAENKHLKKINKQLQENADSYLEMLTPYLEQDGII